MKLSIVIPSKDRSDLLSIQLNFLKSQFKDLEEIIIVDNSSSLLESKKIKSLCKQHKCIRYIKSGNLNVSDNWDLAISSARGDYVSLITDKMFFADGALLRIKKNIKLYKPDIFSWNYCYINFEKKLNLKSKVTIDNFVDFNNDKPYFFSGWQDLKNRCDAKKSRVELSIEKYNRGKICFGFYSKKILKKIKNLKGNYCKGSCPDYSSLLAALYLSKKSIHSSSTYVYFIHPGKEQKWSTGHQAHLKELFAKKLFDQLDKKIKSFFLVPNLYISQHNFVSSEFLNFLKLINKVYLFNFFNWSLYIMEDVFFSKRVWISGKTKKKQIYLFLNYIKKNLSTMEYKKIKIFFYFRAFKQFLYFKLRQLVKNLIFKSNLKIKKSFYMKNLKFKN